MKLWQRWKQTSIANKLLVQTGTIVAFGTLFQLYILRESSQQSSKQTDRVIAAAERIARSGETANEANKRAVERSLEQSKIALDAAAAATHRDQRAWLQIVRFALDKEPTGNDMITASWDVINSGKTPATKVINRGQLSVWAPEAPAPNWKAIKPEHPAIIFPGTATYRLRKSLAVEARYSEAYRAGRMNIYVRTLMCYRDVFAVTHWVKTCAFHAFGQPLGDFSLCDTSNDIGTEDTHAWQECRP